MERFSINQLISALIFILYQKDYEASLSRNQLGGPKIIEPDRYSPLV